MSDTKTETKTLYMLIRDCGDGSNSLSYTFDSALVQRMQANEDQLDDEWQSGDGLQVKELTLPAECTYDSLGISKWSVLNPEDYAHLGKEEEDDDE